MRPTALLGLGGFALLAALIYGLWPSAEVPPAVSGIATPPRAATLAPAATRAAQPSANPPGAAAPATVAAAPTQSPGAAGAMSPAVAGATPSTTSAAGETPSTAAAPGTAAASPAAAAMAPRFDVVRVGLRGSAVVAGRAAPGAEVLLFVDGRRELGRARADGRGEWVILPADPLPSGAWELSLRSRMAGEETAGPDAVVVVVPEAAPTRAAHTAESSRPAATTEPSSSPIAVLIPSTTTSAAPRILQGPQVAPSAGQARAAAPSLGMDSVDYEDGGTIRFAGSAPPGAAVRVYVGARHAGDAVADAAGRWVLAPDEQPPVGRNSLRVDQVAASGAVAARVEVPFQRDALPADAFDTHRVVVQPGTNLWRIARASYGRGTHFTTIYQANRHQIRDPRMIFPGQIFDLPEAQAAPSASSASR